MLSRRLRHWFLTFCRLRSFTLLLDIVTRSPLCSASLLSISCIWGLDGLLIVIHYLLLVRWNSFFAAHYGPGLLFPDALPIPLPYYWLLVPGFVLALWHKRFEIVPMATLPVVGVFVSGGPAIEQRLLLAIP